MSDRVSHCDWQYWNVLINVLINVFNLFINIFCLLKVNIKYNLTYFSQQHPWTGFFAIYLSTSSTPGTLDTRYKVGENYVRDDAGVDPEITRTPPDSVLLISTEATIDFGGVQPVNPWVHDTIGEEPSLGDELSNKSTDVWTVTVRYISK